VPPPMQNLFDLNEAVRMIEEYIPPQPAVQEHVQVQIQEPIIENVQVQGFPIPPLVNLIGDEIPIDELLGDEMERTMSCKKLRLFWSMVSRIMSCKKLRLLWSMVGS